MVDLHDMDRLGAAPTTFPMEQNLGFTPSDGELLKDPSQCRRLVRFLIYLTITRLDITYFVHLLSQFMHQPRNPHLDATIRVLRYLKGTPRQDLLFPTKNELN